MSPTQLSLKLLRENGYLAEVVERWVPKKPIRKDLFGFVDIVAVPARQDLWADGRRVLFVQTTTASNLSARRKKIREHPLFIVVGMTADIHLHGWKKVDGQWTVVEEVLN